ncbi:RNA polymerase, sigma 38 subunit, RpoS [Pedobacter westerhofensis]|uniref:RNA polymerase, sigma 38 subunit, RpoS n=1 Tax=Pedobacter westerhofensis TaxID=425512 RepID=A0A521AEW7_9SPHI|nr:RNA polymerase sigma factor RpoD/SigA [Pedobacter westerhofensis]SMO33341.1 RNA polymerase, sigma 38 subunit, RpoS [Pedobacter westerhofensis]
MRQLKISESITNRETASLNQYLSDIAKIPMVTPQEEVTLTQKIREGDQAALERLTTANLRFVVSVAKQYQSSGLTLGDLINEGNVGLVKAAKRFDETKGFKFISYAVWWIRQAILSAINEQSRMVRLPLNKVGEISKIAKAASQLEQQFERQPTPEELAENLELTAEKISDVLGHSARHISYDSPFSSDEENTLLDVLQSSGPATDTGLIAESLSYEVSHCMRNLGDKEKDILTLFFGLGNQQAQSLEEIGDRYHLTRERVRQIKDKALNRLRANSKTWVLKGYLD